MRKQTVKANVNERDEKRKLQTIYVQLINKSSLYVLNIKIQMILSLFELIHYKLPIQGRTS